MTDLDQAEPAFSPPPTNTLPPVRRRSAGRAILVLFILILVLVAGAAMAYKLKLIGHAQTSSAGATTAPSTSNPGGPASSGSSASGSSASAPLPIAQPAPAPPAAKPQAPNQANSAPTPNPSPIPLTPADPNDAKIAAMQAQIAQLSATVLADHAALVRLQASAASLPKIAARAGTMAQLATATMELQSGQPLGVIPNAPEALVRYAHRAPPTEAGLRAQFATLAPRAAAQAGMANSGNTGLWARLRAHVVDLISLRRGDQVLIGSRADGTLAAIRRDLALGDLPSAVAAVKTLPAPARAVLQSWLTQADDLLAARAALAQMAEPS